MLRFVQIHFNKNTLILQWNMSITTSPGFSYTGLEIVLVK